MTTQQNELWLKIQQFNIDDPQAEVPFSSRLAAAQGWDADFTQRAIEEYKKFMLLAATAGFSVTPSLVIDEVWHEHITFTKSYWVAFCQGVLGKEIHHTPSGGSEVEEAKFREAFQQTLQAYITVFQENPPRDIWLEDPKVVRLYAENAEKRGVGQFVAFVLAGLIGIMGSSFIVFIVLMILGNIAVAAVYPSPPTFSADGGGSCGGGGCSSCGCGGCGGCGGG
jgi:hypothetical protein